MNEQLKLATQIAGRTLLKWVLLVIAGWVISLICFMVVLFKNAELSGGGHGNVWGFVINLFAVDTAGFLLFIGAPIFMILYFVIANKIAVVNSIHLLLKSKAGDLITAKVRSLMDRLMADGTWVAKGSDAAMLRARLLQANMNDPDTSKLQRRVIQFGFQKISLDDIDFQKDDLKLSTIVTDKVDRSMRETSKPSLWLFWLLVLVQLSLLAWSLLT